jgi:hypothetical protein
MLNNIKNPVDKTGQLEYRKEGHKQKLRKEVTQ